MSTELDTTGGSLALRIGRITYKLKLCLKQLKLGAAKQIHTKTAQLWGITVVS